MRVGVVGAGFIGRTHIRAAQAVRDIEVIGFVDPMASSDRPELKGLRAFDTLQTLLREKPDGVVVAVPDEFHVSVATDCLREGVAVMLEKPAARSLAEGLQLARAAPDVQARLLVAHQRRHHPAARAVKGLIEQNLLGKLIGVGGVFALRKDDHYFVERPRGVGLVNLIHDLDLLQHFCGRLNFVNAVVSHQARNAREEDTIALTMEFESGVVGSMVATDSSPSPWGWDQATTELPSIPYNKAGTTYSLLGTKASLSIPDLRLFKHNEGEAWHQPLVQDTIEVIEGNAYVNQLSHFVDVMRGTARPIVGIKEALATQAGLEGVFVSAREGRRVSTDELIKLASEQ